MKYLAMIAALMLAACQPGDAPPSPSAAAVATMQDLFLVGVYDPARDPSADLQLAVTKASTEGKRILLDVGGEWCSWCHILDGYLEANADVRTAFAGSFVVMKVNWSDDNKNEAFLSGYPKIPGYPHFFVLAGDGSFVSSESTAELEQGDSYDKARMLAFAEKYR